MVSALIVIRRMYFSSSRPTEKCAIGGVTLNHLSWATLGGGKKRRAIAARRGHDQLHNSHSRPARLARNGRIRTVNSRRPSGVGRVDGLHTRFVTMCHVSKVMILMHRFKRFLSDTVSSSYSTGQVGMAMRLLILTFSILCTEFSFYSRRWATMRHTGIIFNHSHQCEGC